MPWNGPLSRGKGPWRPQTALRAARQSDTPKKAAFENDWEWAGDDAALSPVADGGYQQTNQNGLVEDGWYWQDDESQIDSAMEIDATTQYALDGQVFIANQPSGEFTADEDYEDPTTDLVESASGPVQANAPPLDASQDNTWDWGETSDEDVYAITDDPVSADQPALSEESWPFFDDQPEDEWQTIVDDDDDAVGDDQQQPLFDDVWLDDPADDDWALDDFQTDAPPVADDSWLWLSEDDEEAPGESSPVGPDAALATDQPSQDPWSWGDEVADDLLLDDLAPDAPAIPDDAWFWSDEFDAEFALDEPAVGPDEPSIQQDEWLWEEDPAVEDAADAPLGADLAAGLPDIAFQTDIDWSADEPPPTIIHDTRLTDEAGSPDLSTEDAPDFTIEVDDDFFDDFGTEDAPEPALEEPWFDDHEGDDWWVDEPQQTGGQATTPDQPPEDAPEFAEADDELWWADIAYGFDADGPAQDAPDFDQDVEDPFQTQDGPVGANASTFTAQAYAEDWDWNGEDTEDDGWWVESTYASIDAAAAVDIVLQADPDFDDTDEPLQADESAPVGQDAQTDQPADPWDWHEELEADTWTEDRPQDADQPPEDAPLFESEIDDDWQADAFTTDNEPQPPQADAWNWDEEPADDDAWWQPIDHVLVDPLAGPTYAEAWDFNADDTDDDAWWVEIPEPDPAGLPLDTCPADLIAAMARIAELEALLAAALANAGGGGGGAGGDGDDNIGVRSREEIEEQARIFERRRAEKRARIAQQNALIMALCGAVVHGLKSPKETK